MLNMMPKCRRLRKVNETHETHFVRYNCQLFEQNGLYESFGEAIAKSKALQVAAT